MVGVYIIFLYTPTHGQEIVKGCENIFWVLVQPILTAFFSIYRFLCKHFGDGLPEICTVIIPSTMACGVK